uniref:Transposase (Putative), gypsy type n=1 Tax=Tanacetum cinerariifolium TaxID=118510 RepID=A0A699IB66_TANCI|nr:hypothetical protein [Tanacetum cinerariifolium]
MGRDTVQIETAVNTISHEYLLEFTSEYGIPETLHPELPGSEDRIVDFPEGKVAVYTRFFEFANFRFPLSQFLFDVLGYYQIHLSQLSVIGGAKGGCHSVKGRKRIPPQCYTKPLDSLKNWNNRFFWVDERVFPTVVDWRTNAPKDGMPAVSTYSIEAVRALDTHRTPIQKQPEMLLCLVGISHRYYLGDEVYGSIQFNSCSKSYEGEDRKPPTRPHEVPLLTLTATRVIEMDDPAAATDSSGVPSTIEKSPLDFADEAKVSDQGTVAPEMPPSKDVPATDAPGAGQADEVVATDPPAATKRRSSHGGKSLAAIQLGLASTVFVPENAPAGVSDPDPLSFADPPSFPSTAAAGDPDSENASSHVEVRSSESIYRPEWGVANGSLLDTPEACQDLVDHLRLRFEQEAKMLRKFVAQVARRDKRIQARELEIKNLEALLETEADMKKAAEDRSAGIIQELEDMRARFSDLQVSNERLSQQVATLQEQVSGEEKLKAAFEEFKRYEDDRVKQRCAELDARLDALSIDFDEDLYPHMLTAIVGRRRLQMSCPQGLPKALKDLKYPLVDQLGGLKDAPMDVIMAVLYLKSDSGGDASQYIRDLCPSSSQLTIPVYPEVRDPRNPWAYREEMLLADAIAVNISRSEKKKNAA